MGVSWKWLAAARGRQPAFPGEKGVTDVVQVADLVEGDDFLADDAAVYAARDVSVGAPVRDAADERAHAHHSDYCNDDRNTCLCADGAWIAERDRRGGEGTQRAEQREERPMVQLDADESQPEQQPQQRHR